MKRFHSLRLRMMLLFCAVVGVLLAGSYASLYILLSRTVRAEFDRRLVEAASPLAADLRNDADTQDVAELNLPEQYFEVIDTSGKILALSKNLEGRPLPLARVPVVSAGPQITDLPGLPKLRMIAVPIDTAKRSSVLLLAMPVLSRNQALESFQRVLLGLFLCSLLVMALVSAWYVGRSLRPVSALTRQATWMTAHLHDSPAAPSREPGLLAPLPPVHGDDELGQLAEAFNQLFLGMEAALAQLRQFVSDASHELRTPLSILQGETELLLAQTRSPEEYKKTLRVIHEELRKLSRIVEGLFTLAMADAGQLRLTREPIYLNEVLEEACALAAQHARAKNITIQRALDGEVPYEGDEAFLRQLFLILLENAVKYSPHDTNIRVHLERFDGHFRIEFRDQGFGIAPEHLPRIFERFYRVPANGDGESQSGGLGLSIAQAIVRAQGGEIECASTAGSGSCFTVKLPAQAAAPEPSC
jgi:two-component system, OmpR family, sensor kinase